MLSFKMRFTKLMVIIIISGREMNKNKDVNPTPLLFLLSHSFPNKYFRIYYVDSLCQAEEMQGEALPSSGKDRWSTLGPAL